MLQGGEEGDGCEILCEAYVDDVPFLEEIRAALKNVKGHSLPPKEGVGSDKRKELELKGFSAPDGWDYLFTWGGAQNL